MSIERFRKVYSTLPEKEKDFPIVVVDNITFSWTDAFKEIQTNLELGKKIQKKLEELKII